jgi:hypothetical protein
MSLHLGEDVTDDLSLRVASHITQLWPCHRMVQVYAMYDRRDISTPRRSEVWCEMLLTVFEGIVLGQVEQVGLLHT